MIAIALALVLQDAFSERVAPVLRAKCAGCHGEDPAKLKGELDVTSRAGLLKGGESGQPSILPGDPEKSPLYVAVTRRDPEFKMPPKDRDKLSAEEVEAFRAWIAGGAPWPSSGWSGGSAADRWAFLPVKDVAPPGDGHPVDAFLGAALRAKDLAPAPAADRATLLRRVTFDLTGLPPTPEEVAAGEAWEATVDRLLASPRYGEQWARHWLDVARYADSSGFSNDFERPNAWRYRDYVIRSLNADVPFDRFTVDQIAGDELDPADPEKLVAAGFLRMGPWEHTAMSVAAETRQFFLDDVTHQVAAVFLGLTMRCARCHDHKFDPLPTRDYYRLQAVFAPTQFAEREAPFLPSENTAGLAAARAATEARLKEKGYRTDGGVPDGPAAKRSLEKVGTKRREHLERELLRAEPLAFSVYAGPPRTYTSNQTKHPLPASREGEAADVFVLKGGALDAPGDRVEPGVPSAPVGLRAPERPDRLGLARWIADPANPLAPRVIVNRVWQHHFGGKGIVATPNNLGKMGKRPTHPELLDWLAGWFVKNGRSLKALHRLILTSDAYRRSDGAADAGDPGNDLLAVYPIRRLAAEEIRDAMLAVSGELRPEMGGPGVFPEINWDVALQPRHVMGGPAPMYQPSPRPDDRHRRTIYAFRLRTLADPMLEVLNRPGTEMSCERRDETTVTPQVFALFNGAFVHDRALATARRLENGSKDPAGRIDAAFRLAYGRPPSREELARCLDHHARMLERHRAAAPVRADPPRSVRREMIEEFTGETVRWIEDLDLMKAFVPDVKPWDVGPETRALAEICLVLFNSNEFLYVR
ncbi:MAG TPA: PSD1 and planctomycete cytochrome C domain-containing protein [Planctomycetota bacterium]